MMGYSLEQSIGFVHTLNCVNIDDIFASRIPYAITEEVLETFDLIPKCMLGTKSLFDVMKRYQNNMEVAYRRGLCSKTKIKIVK